MVSHRQQYFSNGFALMFRAVHSPADGIVGACTTTLKKCYYFLIKQKGYRCPIVGATTMDLILWRHAEAEDGFLDIERALTGKGRKQAKKMAGWLKPRLPQDVRILVSPAKRALQTAAALGLDFSTLEEIAPGASPRALLKAAHWPQGEHSVLIVGHQPTLGEVAALLLGGQDASWNIKKGAVWWFTSHTLFGSNECVLRAVISPDLL
jgi:phosphohistidine phosphatase